MLDTKVETENLAETFSFEKEILDVGVWNGTKFTSDDLASIVSSFNELRKRYDVPCKLGHNNEQDILKNDGLPAAGFVTKLIQKGSKIIATITNVPKAIKELIENKAYKNVSVEMIKNWKDGGTDKTYKWILSGLAILGADRPAVKGLNGFLGLYSDKDNVLEFIYSEDLSIKRIANDELKIKEEDKRSMDELKKVKEELALKESELKKFSEEKEINEKEIKAMRAEKVLFIQEKKEQEIKEFVAEFSTGNNIKILPAQKEMFTELIKSFSVEETLVFSENKISQKDMLKEILKSMPNSVDLTEKSRNIEIEKPVSVDEISNYSEDSSKLDVYAKRIEVKNKCSYDEAIRQASKEHPELI